jgi:hypothetical protein
MATGRQFAALAFSVLTLCACASKPEPSDYDMILKRGRPPSDEARKQECAWIATSLDREKRIGGYITSTSTYPEVVVSYQETTQRNIAVLQARAQALNCNQARAGSFDDCFSRCRQYTERTREQCFDACNK